MSNENNTPAEWRSKMTESEREELALSEMARNAVGSQHRILTKRMKDRCIKRLRRDAE